MLRLNFPLLIEIKGADPEKVAALVRDRKDVIVFSVHPGKVQRLTGVTRFGLYARMVRFPKGVEGLGLSRRLVTPAVVRAVHRRGLNDRMFGRTACRYRNRRHAASLPPDPSADSDARDQKKYDQREEEDS